MIDTPSWVGALREASRAAVGTQGARAHGAVEVVRGTRPGLLASDAIHALTSSLLTALVIAAALLRTRLSAGGFDLIALLLRTASVAFALRSLIALWRWGRRLQRDGAASAHVLAWSHDGLLWSSPERERWLSRNDIVGFSVPEERTVRGAATALAPLLVVARPTLRPEYWQLPPYFAVHADVLLARLSRTFLRAEPESPALPPPQAAAEQRYRRAADGKPQPGELPVPEGFGYRLRAPYGVLLALVFVADAVMAAGPLRARIWPAAVLAGLLALGTLAAWFAWMRRRRAARLGLAMVLTPEELLLRGKHGVLSVPWSQLAGAEVSATLAWSPLVGSYLVRVLWFSTLDGARMPFDGSFLGVPTEVVATLALAYRSGALLEGSASPAAPDGAASAGTPVPASASSACQGSGAGGGISGTDGTTNTPRSATFPSLDIDSDSAAAALGRSNDS